MATQFNELSSNAKFVNSLFLNIGCIPKHLTEFESDFLNGAHRYDFLCFSENRLTEDTAPIYKIDNNYTMHSNHRNSFGGGVTIYASNRCSFIEFINVTILTEFIETMFIKVNICFLAMYCRMHSSTSKCECKVIYGRIK